MIITYIALVPTYSKNEGEYHAPWILKYLISGDILLLISFEVRFHRIIQQLGDRQSPVQSIEAATLQLPAAGTVRDVKFVDDYSVLMLLSINGMYIHVLSFPLSLTFLSDPQTFNPASPQMQMQTTNYYFFFACFSTSLDGSLLLRLPLGHIFDLNDSSKMDPPAGSAQNPHTSPTSKQQIQQKQQHLKQMLLPNGKPRNPSSSKKIYNSLSDINKEYIIHTFKEHATFTPARLVVNTRDHDAKYAFATAAAAIVVVVAEQGKSYRIFGIDGKWIEWIEEKKECFWNGKKYIIFVKEW